MATCGSATPGPRATSSRGRCRVGPRAPRRGRRREARPTALPRRREAPSGCSRRRGPPPRVRRRLGARRPLAIISRRSGARCRCPAPAPPPRLIQATRTGAGAGRTPLIAQPPVRPRRRLKARAASARKAARLTDRPTGEATRPPRGTVATCEGRRRQGPRAGARPPRIAPPPTCRRREHRPAARSQLRRRGGSPRKVSQPPSQARAGLPRNRRSRPRSPRHQPRSRSRAAQRRGRRPPHQNLSVRGDRVARGRPSRRAALW